MCVASTALGTAAFQLGNPTLLKTGALSSRCAKCSLAMIYICVLKFCVRRIHAKFTCAMKTLTSNSWL